jgi:hypothetical protein
VDINVYEERIASIFKVEENSSILKMVAAQSSKTSGPIYQSAQCHILELNHHRLLVRFEVFTAVAMINGVFWDVTPCGSCKNRRFGGT